MTLVKCPILECQHNNHDHNSLDGICTQERIQFESEEVSNEEDDTIEIMLYCLQFCEKKSGQSYSFKEKMMTAAYQHQNSKLLESLANEKTKETTKT